MKHAFLILMIMALFLSSCRSTPEAAAAQEEHEEVENPCEIMVQEETEQDETSDEEEDVMKMYISNIPVEVVWEDNESVTALKELVNNSPLSIAMSMYGGFEQVGSIGSSLPRNDVQTTTASGDIVLYSGNQLVVFYGPNSWAYTRLGRITDKSAAEMAELLGNGDVTITLAME